MEIFQLSAAETNSVAGTNAPATPNAPTFEVRGYHIQGNSVLPPEKFSILTNYIGPAVDLPRMRQGLAELQLLYRHLGYATISVTLPQQKLTNGVVYVQVVQGRLSKINVQGNHYFSSNNVLRALPSLEADVLLNTKWFQPELDRANGNRDRQIYPVIAPGFDPGTTELTLKIEDRLPLHAHMEINNKATPNTPVLRLDTAAQYNNLWQREHQLGLEYNFSPQALKQDDYLPNFLDQPMVASYSGFYRVPLDFGGNLRENYDRFPVDFGYDQVTHQFRLPPSTGNPELILFASRSASDTAPIYSPETIVTNVAGRLKISQQTVQRTRTFNNDAGFKFTLPLRDIAGVRSSASLGLDWKSYESSQFVTNFTYARLLDSNNVPYATFITSNTPNSHSELFYFPLSFNWSGSRTDKSGSTSFYWNQNVFLSPLASAQSDFQKVANSSKAGGNYTTTALGITREQQLPKDWSMLLRAAGQWSSAPLIGNEQFALGGTGGVRGYQEGESYGDTGWRALLDLRAPPINVGSFPSQHEAIPADLRCSWFMDYGENYQLERSGPLNDSVQQWGTGLGFYLTIGQHVDARLTLAWALLDTHSTHAGETRAYFSIGAQF